MAELTRAQASEKMQNIIANSENENASLKFGVLIGLIKVESIHHSEVVNTILHLVSDNISSYARVFAFILPGQEILQQKV